MKTGAFLALLHLAAAFPARADGALPAETLDRLKAGTVFVKATAGRRASAGAGFVLHVQGRTVYLATNQHVVLVPGDEDPRPGLPPPHLPPRAGQVKVVFASGTRHERELPAAVVFRDPAQDLAVLRVEADNDLPLPAAIPRGPRPTETMPVYVLGFPFGEKLGPGGKGPAVTVGRGAVSSLREDGGGRLARVQIEAEVHPGNSGGPVVDAEGRLVGMTAAKVRGTRIGLALPAAYLDELLRGRFVEAGLFPRRLEPQVGVVCVNVLLFDPLHKVRSVRVDWLPPEIDTGGPRARGSLAAVKGSRSVALAPGKSTWQGHFRLPIPEEGAVAVPFQVVLSREEGGPQVTPVFTFRWEVPGPKRPTDRPLAEEELAAVSAALRRPREDFRPRRAAMERLAAAVPGGSRAEVLGLVRQALDDPDVYVRESGARALRAWAGYDGLPDLVRRLKEEELPWVRWALLEELGRLPGDEAARAVVGDLARDGASGFPAAAVRAMGPAAEKHLRPLLGRPEPVLRAEACRLLGAVGTEQSVPALESAAAAERDPLVAEAARAALKAIQGRK